MNKNLLVALTAAVLAACATDYKPVYSYNEILIVKNSKELIRDLSINLTGTGRRFNCANVAPLGICPNEFSRRPCACSPIEVGWTFGNEIQPARFVLAGFAVGGVKHLHLPNVARQGFLGGDTGAILNQRPE